MISFRVVAIGGRRERSAFRESRPQKGLSQQGEQLVGVQPAGDVRAFEQVIGKVAFAMVQIDDLLLDGNPQLFKAIRQSAAALPSYPVKADIALAKYQGERDNGEHLQSSASAPTRWRWRQSARRPIVFRGITRDFR